MYIGFIETNRKGFIMTNASVIFEEAKAQGFGAVVHVTYSKHHGGYIANLLTNSVTGDAPNHVYSDKGECISDAIDWRDAYERVTGIRTRLWAVNV